MLHVDPNLDRSILPPNVEIADKLIDMHGQTLILSGGRQINDIDTVIFCTGYSYIFPFFEKSDPQIIKIKDEGKVVSPLFEHVVHVDYMDSLFIISMCNIAAFFLLIEYQVKFAMALMEGRAVGIDMETVRRFEEERYK